MPDKPIHADDMHSKAITWLRFALSDAFEKKKAKDEALYNAIKDKMNKIIDKACLHFKDFSDETCWYMTSGTINNVTHSEFMHGIKPLYVNGKKDAEKADELLIKTFGREGSDFHECRRIYDIATALIMQAEVERGVHPFNFMLFNYRW